MFKSKWYYIGCGIGVEGAIMGACAGMLFVSLLFAICAYLNWAIAERKEAEEKDGRE